MKSLMSFTHDEASSETVIRYQIDISHTGVTKFWLCVTSMLLLTLHVNDPIGKGSTGIVNKLLNSSLTLPSHLVLALVLFFLRRPALVLRPYSRIRRFRAMRYSITPGARRCCHLVAKMSTHKRYK